MPYDSAARSGLSPSVSPTAAPAFSSTDGAPGPARHGAQVSYVPGGGSWLQALLSPGRSLSFQVSLASVRSSPWAVGAHRPPCHLVSFQERPAPLWLPGGRD